ncbi:PREDICTED: uncharacterized protein LOC18590565 [Theobroma cacao]|uniref:Uncharacterized protein LOC18590565 n=1 Tax=Theobroma cacao TaxID=3641 RepID=A0AB32WXW9_THECC|nr:PREDICTED: uncharacterized protein LOC18590565 [Theobroma cacao]
MLRLKIDESKPLMCFVCRTGCKLLSHYETAICNCGERMDCMSLEMNESTRTDLDTRDRGVFVKGPNRLIVSDELQVMPSSTAASFSLFSKLGIIDTSSIEEKTFSMGVDKALNLLKCLLVSKQPLTEAFLEQNPVSMPSKEDFEQVRFTKSKLETETNDCGKIFVKLMVSQSKNRVCCAEASEDFIDLLFSFLPIPLGFIVKEMQGDTSKGNIYNLYDSIQDLDAKQSLKSKENMEMLVSPKLAPGFGYEKQPLNIKEYMQQPYYLYIGAYNHRRLTSDKTRLSFADVRSSVALTVMDPKSHSKDTTSGRGYVTGPAIFTITDALMVTPMSPITGPAALSKLKVPFSDIEERTVHVGEKEALRLPLVSCYNSESALTRTFLLKEPNQAM